MRSALRFTFLLLALLVVLSAGSSLAGVRVSVAGGYEKISSVKENHLEYISLSELAAILGGSLDWEMIGQQVLYDGETFRFRFVIGSPFFMSSDSAFNMTYPALYRDGQLYVQPQTFLPFLDRVTQQKINWDSRKREIRIDAEYFNVTDIAFSSKTNGLLIEIFLTSSVAYDIFVTEGNYLNISIRDGQLNSARIMSRKDSRFIYRMNTYQVDNTGQISIRLRRSIEKWTHKLVFDPPRIQISIADPGFNIADTDTAPTIGPDTRIDVIVIDPGHGGEDYGAIGPSGTREKEVSLAIAKELARLVRKEKQFKVVMTRDRDRNVTLQERAEMANAAGCDLFISIHANASPKSHARGWNVFFLAPANNDSARSVEQLENSYFLRESYGALEAHLSGAQEPVDPVLNILNEMIMSEFQAESHDFAMMVDREMRRYLKTPARGVDQAGFFVLNKVFTPSVLIEAGFISNKTEERLLKSRKFQRKIAKAVYGAMLRFKAKYESM